jgi:hypothetical protein
MNIAYNVTYNIRMTQLYQASELMENDLFHLREMCLTERYDAGVVHLKSAIQKLRECRFDGLFTNWEEEHEGLHWPEQAQVVGEFIRALEQAQKHAEIACNAILDLEVWKHGPHGTIVSDTAEDVLSTITGNITVLEELGRHIAAQINMTEKHRGGKFHATP